MIALFEPFILWTSLQHQHQLPWNIPILPSVNTMKNSQISTSTSTRARERFTTKARRSSHKSSSDSRSRSRSKIRMFTQEEQRREDAFIEECRQAQVGNLVKEGVIKSSALDSLVRKSKLRDGEHFGIVGFRIPKLSVNNPVQLQVQFCLTTWQGTSKSLRTTGFKWSVCMGKAQRNTLNLMTQTTHFISSFDLRGSRTYLKITPSLAK